MLVVLLPQLLRLLVARLRHWVLVPQTLLIVRLKMLKMLLESQNNTMNLLLQVDLLMSLLGMLLIEQQGVVHVSLQDRSEQEKN